MYFSVKIQSNFQIYDTYEYDTTLINTAPYDKNRLDKWNITTQNNEHDLHRGSPTHLFLFLCRTIDVISSSGIVPVPRDLHQRSRYGDRVPNRP